jgi:hypothetical protein
MLDSETVYTVGEPIPYVSIYGYDKRRLPILRADDGTVVGHAKEEIVKGEDGQEVSRTFYTRDINRNPGMLRFYASPEALIVGFGGKVEPKKGTVLRKKVAAARPKKKVAASKRAKKPASRVKKVA